MPAEAAPPPRRAASAGVAEAVGAPAVAMAATFLAFGAAVREAGLPIGWALAASWGVYGMPGQIVLVQHATAGAAGVLPAVLGAVAVNARFLPMAIALAPMLAAPRRPRAWSLLGAPFVAITPWAAAMRALPGIAPPGRLPWFLGFGLTSWLIAGAAAAAGHAVAGLLDPATRAALVFANPLYFALLLAADLGRPGVRGALLGGALAAPLALALPAAWGLLAAGLAGGTTAFLLGRGTRRRG
ncbi:AzlC family ABC transporter permease [Caldovatus aquaticus]|uniref:AzlC family ABC transporter permease n=1 Tax=Caldovatus aquaticus TaxID=2865671 RepID=A0ABS7F5F6_9PROT|nr:AzlC family ABC transporter permease [Caldovatus aquaticus]MBW8270794.1 AzlC family ABC transporter permease [Caldovatus aquaticus]